MNLVSLKCANRSARLPSRNVNLLPILIVRAVLRGLAMNPANSVNRTTPFELLNTQPNVSSCVPARMTPLVSRSPARPPSSCTRLCSLLNENLIAVAFPLSISEVTVTSMLRRMVLNPPSVMPPNRPSNPMTLPDTVPVQSSRGI